ncbi:MAG: hypothetical protein ABIH80_03530 [Methanobacteriota archaeon]
MNIIEDDDRIEMNRKKIVFVGLLGAIFLIAGLYFSSIDPKRSDFSFEYFGIGTWIAGIVFFVLYPKYKEIISFILGLLVLHAGILLILKDQYSNPKLLGFLIFTSGVIIVLSSGFSDYTKNREKK